MIIFLSCYSEENQQKRTKAHVTIFVHGIMSIKPYISLMNMFRFIQDNVINTLYAKGIELTRRNKYFWWGQAMQGFGLEPIDLTTIEKTNAASAIALLYDQIFVKSFGDSDERYYYTFGWSGLLSHKKRYYDAHEFFIHLEQLVRILEAQNKEPVLTIIGYSHGGNVALDLAAVHERFYPDSQLQIERLILLGVPLLTETDHLVNSPLFKKVYNIVSPLDRIQELDFFSFSRFFSAKFFKNRRNFKIPSKVTQIVLKIMRPVRTQKGPLIKEKRKILRKDFENPAIISGKSHLFSNASAGHIELWFFGWTPQHYTKNFIFNPLPIVVFLPYIIASIENSQSDFEPYKKIVADMRPDDDVMLLKQYNSMKKVCIVKPFIEKQFLSEMKDIALLVRPDNYTDYDFKRYLNEAYKNAALTYSESLFYIKKATHNQKKRVRMRMKTTLKDLE